MSILKENLCIHDTTTFIFSGEREGLGFVNKTSRGFLGHFSLAISRISSETAVPLGLAAASLWTRETLRADKGVSPHHLRTTSDCESHRWLSAVQEVEGRQLDSYQTLKIALALTLPIAWSMLLMRTQSRSNDNIPAKNLMEPLRLKILIAHSVRYKLPTEPTLKDVAYAIAGMGGHLKQNGPPGWQTLMRGFERLLTLEEGWLMSRKTCDQS